MAEECMTPAYKGSLISFSATAGICATVLLLILFGAVGAAIWGGMTAKTEADKLLDKADEQLTKTSDRIQWEVKKVESSLKDRLDHVAEELEDLVDRTTGDLRSRVDKIQASLVRFDDLVAEASGSIQGTLRTLQETVDELTKTVALL